MSVKEWVLTNSSLLVLAAAILVARSLLRPERIDRWLDWGLGPLGWARDISPLVHVIFRWGSTLILVFILADVAGLTDGVRAALGALGLAGLVVGFAGQHVIQNILAGIMILLDGDNWRWSFARPWSVRKMALWSSYRTPSFSTPWSRTPP
jgi:small-conductance mechanosensitive channel